MSPMPIHQLHVLAVHQLAASYRAGEIASSGMAMQGGSVCEDFAGHVLRVGMMSFSLSLYSRISHPLCNDRTMQIRTFSTKRYHLSLSLISYPLRGFYSPGEGRQLCQVYYDLRSRRTHQGLSLTTRAVLYTRDRPHFLGRVFRRRPRTSPKRLKNPTLRKARSFHHNTIAATHHKATKERARRGRKIARSRMSKFLPTELAT